MIGGNFSARSNVEDIGAIGGALMAKRLIPDPAEIRGQIGRLRERVAKWRSLIEATEGRIAQLDADQAAGNEQPRASQPPEDDRTGS